MVSMRYFIDVWFACPSKWTPLAVVTSTNLPGFSATAFCIGAAAGEPLCAVVVQPPSRIAAKPNTRKGDLIGLCLLAGEAGVPWPRPDLLVTASVLRAVLLAHSCNLRSGNRSDPNPCEAVAAHCSFRIPGELP